MKGNSNDDFRKTCKVGQYFYGRHRRNYGVWVYVSVSESAASGRFVDDFPTIEEARAFVWEKNGWGKPRKALS